MKRQTFVLSAVAFLFLLQLAIMPAAVLANADAIQSTVAEAGWEGLPILAQPEGFEGMEAGEGLTPEQQQQLEQGMMAFFAAFAMVFAVIFVVVLVIEIFVLFQLYKVAARIPEEHQQVGPVMVWLLLIPCVNLVMLFIVFPGIVKGFKSYFASQDRTDVEDCGAGLVKWFLITAVASIVPFVNYIAGPAAFVIFIMLFMKFLSLKNLIPEGDAPAA